MTDRIFSRITAIALPCLCVILMLSCNDDKPVEPPRMKTIHLRADYADFTEAGLVVSFTELQSENGFRLERNGETVFEGTCVGADTLLIDEGLRPSVTYFYRALKIRDGIAVDSSDFVPVRMRDTSSHNYRFEIDTLGGEWSGASDVVAFSRDNAWVTGEFLIYDYSTKPPTYETYNLAHWDGKKWTYMMVPDKDNASGGSILFALNPNYMIISTHMRFLYNGSEWTRVYIPENTLHKGLYGIWSEKPTEIHMVGGQGTWTIWDGKTTGGNFKKLVTPTTVDLGDIYGDGGKIFAAGLKNDLSRSVVLKYENNRFTVIDSFEVGLTKSPLTKSCWYHAGDDVLALTGSKTRLYHRNRQRFFEPTGLNWHCTIVRGTGLDNIWVGGHNSTLRHYNGVSWKSYDEMNARRVIKRISVHEDFFFAVGYGDFPDGTLRGFAIRGYKQ